MMTMMMEMAMKMKMMMKTRTDNAAKTEKRNNQKEIRKKALKTRKARFIEQDTKQGHLTEAN